MKFAKQAPKIPEKLTLQIAETLAEVPEPQRDAFLAELLRAAREMVSFYEAYDTALVSEVDLVNMPETIGHYQIVRPIGQGAMGKVFEGWDALGKQRVAIKTLAPDLFTGEAGVERKHQRFMREAEIVARLDHPHVVKLIEFMQLDLPYLILEFVDGETLAARIKRSDLLDLKEMDSLMKEISLALGHAHHAGVIHRDLKPANILLNREGKVKLTDFGISKLLGERTLTRTGFLGTPIYAAPEQITGLPLDQRADLFAWGLITHVLLTGHHPFRGATLEQTLYNLANKQPKLSVPKSCYPIQGHTFRQFMQRALAKSAETRFQNAESMYAAFRAMCPRELDPYDAFPSEAEC